MASTSIETTCKGECLPRTRTILPFGTSPESAILKNRSCKFGMSEYLLLEYLG